MPVRGSVLEFALDSHDQYHGMPAASGGRLMAMTGSLEESNNVLSWRLVLECNRSVQQVQYFVQYQGALPC